jgi:hypothetical protein
VKCWLSRRLGLCCTTGPGAGGVGGGGICHAHCAVVVRLGAVVGDNASTTSDWWFALFGAQHSGVLVGCQLKSPGSDGVHFCVSGSGLLSW